MKVEVYKSNGEKAGRQIDLSDDIFGIEPNEHIVYLSVKNYLASRRSGTHKAKERGEVAGSTRKIKRQKGTGTARAGDIKNPLFRGGGRIFGPRPRDYGFKLNKKERALAGRSALSSKVAEDAVRVVDTLNMESPKTKDFIQILKNFNEGGKTLCIVPELSGNLYLSSRNVPDAGVVDARNVSVYEILKAGKVLVEEAALEILGERFANN